jgi:hypothetical protein
MRVRRRPQATYLLRGIPPRLWRDAKIRAAYEGRTLRDVLLALLSRWVEETPPTTLPHREGVVDPREAP